MINDNFFASNEKFYMKNSNDFNKFVYFSSEKRAGEKRHMFFKSENIVIAGSNTTI